MSDTINPIFEHAQNVREKMGYAPLPDPAVIQGDPVPFRTERETPVTDDDFPDEEVTAPAPPPSPLHRLGRTPSPQLSEADAPIRPVMLDLPTPDLVVAGNDAGTSIARYLGREVELTEIEAVAVRRVVLKALQRQVRGQLAEVEALFPKRKRRAKTGLAGKVKLDPRQSNNAFAGLESAEAAGFAGPAVPVKRRRGRPRKVQP